jgi:PIN domain nuclease of toxin-antitoxin system
MNHVLDACAMLAYLRGENGAAVVASSLSNPTIICYAHAINLAEVYYDFMRQGNEQIARQAIAVLVADGLCPILFIR